MNKENFKKLLKINKSLREEKKEIEKDQMKLITTFSRLVGAPKIMSLHPCQDLIFMHYQKTNPYENAEELSLRFQLSWLGSIFCRDSLGKISEKYKLGPYIFRNRSNEFIMHSPSNFPLFLKFLEDYFLKVDLKFIKMIAVYSEKQDTIKLSLDDFLRMEAKRENISEKLLAYLEKT